MFDINLDFVLQLHLKYRLKIIKSLIESNTKNKKNRTFKTETTEKGNQLKKDRLFRVFRNFNYKNRIHIKKIGDTKTKKMLDLKNMMIFIKIIRTIKIKRIFKALLKKIIKT